ncbi:MAG: nucleotidyltransferase family protein [Actinomycetota bacterium]|nr:nucleotidyltransferase family protein [Actinomycetota bacterium]
MSNEATDQEKAKEVFRDVVATLEDGGFDYAVGGGLSTDHWTVGTRTIGDVDLVIREEDAGPILEALARAGYETAEMDRSWLHKAFKDGVTIDLMFELKNGARFDEAFKEHRKTGELFGTVAYVIAPEDQIASLTGTLSRETVGRHWYNILDIMSNNDLDWDYLVARVEAVPLKMLSVLYFAVAEKVPVRKGVIERLQEIAELPEA